MLQAKGVTKRFGGITALENAELEVRKARFMPLVGANGAGKSTLIKIITGAYTNDEGQVYLDGKEVNINLLLMQEHLESCNIPGIFSD